MNVSSIISQFGGVGPLARLLGYPPNTVRNWEVRNSIPSKHQGKILRVGIERGIDIKPEHFIPMPKPRINGKRNGKAHD